MKKKIFMLVLAVALVFSVFTPDYVHAAKSVSKLRIKLGYTSTTYTQNRKTPSVKVYDGTKKLKYGRDFTISYSNNVNPGNAKVKIIGKKSYSGTITKTFKIRVGKPANLTAKVSGTSVQLNWSNPNKCSYYLVNAYINGKPRYSKYKIAKCKSYKFTDLPKGSRVSFKVKAVGGPNKYLSSAGTTTVSIPNSVAPPSLSTPSLLAGSPGYRRADLSWSSVSNASGYYINQYDESKKVSSTVTITGRNNVTYSFYDKPLGSKYTYKVCAYATTNGKTITGNWSKPVTVTASATWTGQAATNKDGYAQGDTTGKEVSRYKWSYSSSSTSANNWTYVLRFKDTNKAEIAAKTMEDICDNDYIGYDNRTYKSCISLFNAAKSNSWNCSSIDNYVTTACSNAIAVCVYATGERASCSDGAIASANALGLYKYLSAMSCFNIYSSSKYVTSDAYLERGDIVITCHPNGKYNHAAMIL